VRAAVIRVGNPFDPLRSRTGQVLRRPRRIRAFTRSRRPVVAILNGRPVLRAEWGRKLRDGDHLAVIVLPRGGGGPGGSNPLSAILSIALMSFAPWAAGALGFAAGTFAHSLATAGIMLAGNALISALLPPPGARGTEQPSPTYTLNAQGNTARLEQPIPVQYGRLLCYPDFAAAPYTEFAGNEQYLYQLLCIGQGHYDIEDVRIEDTPLSSFAEVETEIVPPGGSLTLFPSQVITSVEVSGQEMPPPATASWSRSGTVVTVTETAHGRAAGQAVHLDFGAHALGQGYYQIASVPTADTFTVTVPTGTGSGSVTIQPVVGGINGFVANAAGTAATHVAFDLVFPRGLYRGVDGAATPLSVRTIFQVQRVDDGGLPVGPWITLHDQTVTASTRTPQRRSFRYALPEPGRYRARGRRVTTKEGGTDDGHDVAWAGLRAYLPETRDFGAVTLLAVRMRATNNLSLQASRKISVLCTRKLPVWTGTGWSAPQPTRSIAWALADAARNPVYGAGLADAQIDLAGLLALDAQWAARGDSFDGRFDRPSTWWEAATRIAFAGRAKPFMQGGKLRVVRDGPETVPVAAFSMRNIVKNSFQVEYLMPGPETADTIRGTYLDGATWRPRRVDGVLPGAASAKPVKVDLFGITSRAQAMREAMYLAACNRYRRRVVTFQTEMEGFIPSFGDLIAVQHDTTGWGSHAEAVGWNAGTRWLTLSEPVDGIAGALVVGLRRRDGSVSGPWPVSRTSDPFAVILSAAPDMTPDTGGERERTHVMIGRTATWATLARVRRVAPRGGPLVEIEAVTEDPSVHTAETGRTAPPIVTTLLPRLPRAPVVTGLIGRLLDAAPPRAALSWVPAPGADIYQIEMAEGADPLDPALDWTRAGDTTAAHYVVTLLWAERTLIRVRGVGLAAGPWATTSAGSLTLYMWELESALMWSDDTNVMWSL
jgi:hypothetical protein